MAIKYFQSITQSPAWRRFKANRLGYWSLWIFLVLFVISLFAELIANDRPLLVRYQGSFYAPIVKDYPETTFGGDFPTPTDYLDPDIRKTFSKPGNWALYPLIHYRYDTLNYFAKEPNPASPSSAAPPSTRSPTSGRTRTGIPLSSAPRWGRVGIAGSCCPISCPISWCGCRATPFSTACRRNCSCRSPIASAASGR